MKLWPQPADVAGFFFKGTLGVQRYEVRKQGVGVQPRCKALVKTIGLQHGGIEFVMQLLKHADQALGVDGFVFGC